MAVFEPEISTLQELKNLIETLSPDNQQALLFVAQKLTMSDRTVNKVLKAVPRK